MRHCSLILRLTAVLTVWLVAQATAGAQPPQTLPQPPPRQAAAPVQAATHVSRTDLATAYLRFEMIYARARLDEAETKRVNQAFDNLTLAFFRSNNSLAVKQLDALTASLTPGPSEAPIAALAPYRARLVPPVFVAGRGTLDVSFDRLYESDQEADWAGVTLRLQPAGSGKPIDLPVTRSPDAGAPVISPAAAKKAAARLKPGRYLVGLARGAEVMYGGTWSVVSRPLYVRQTANAKRLALLSPSSPALVQAAASTTARNALLTPSPDSGNTTQMLFDPETLAADVEAEIAALERGENPFLNRAGDFWRIVKTSTRDVPVRVYLPPSARKASPLPLLVAFHGAGGDENMFMEAYGAGLIKRLADERGLLVVSPLTSASVGTANASTFGEFLDGLALDYPIDRARIYLVGHSMGGTAVGLLAGLLPDQIARAACLNGFNGFVEGATKVPPVLVIASELDRIAMPSRIEAAVERVKATGLPVEYRLLKNHGHTLAVTRLLPEVVDWLLTGR